MGKRARKTRWRALDIADDHSDSEESNTNSSVVSSRYSHSNSNGYYSKYSYSSQSTPARRRYNQYDGSIKSTRSSSTTSENKITFNEDEYTRITTPRQDVLFKKGYLNKPKSYQTQTSTGNSTISTGNSTENGTPDHQSTDLDYESQFMFPNGFVDQNGIYYVNSYEPYPLMLFNPPTYYQECSTNKSKRYSTGSLSESMSPNNEEATSQDLSQSGGEASNSGVSDYSGGPPVFNMVFPGYYMNGQCTPTDLANTHHCLPEPVKKLKKRRERKSSKTIPGDSSEYTDENSGDERSETTPLHRVSIPEHQPQEAASRVEVQPSAETQQKDVKPAPNSIPDENIKTASEPPTNNQDQSISDSCADKKTESNEKTLESDQAQPNQISRKPSVLKPDAEEFIPRAFQNLGPPPHIKMMPPNFMPIPLVPIGEFGAQNFAPHPAFIPPGFPINFIPHHMGQKMFPPAPGFVNYIPPVVQEPKIEEKPEQNEEKVISEDNERECAATPSHTPVVEEGKLQMHTKSIDIATVVSKLEAVKQQERHDVEPDVPKSVVNESKSFRGTKPQNFKRNYCNRYRNSPVRSGEASPQILNGDSSPSLQNSPYHFRHSPIRNVEVSNEIQAKINYRNPYIQMHQPIKSVEVILEKTPITNGVCTPTSDYSKQVRRSPEGFLKRSWKPNGYQNGYQNNHNSSKRISNYQTNQKPMTANGFAYSNGHAHNKNYLESITKPPKCPEIIRSNTSPVKTIVTKPIEEPKQDQIKTKSNSQWISVSSRKKKKNKNLEDVDADINDDTFNDVDNSSDIFESYDVNQLVDVVPSSQLETQNPETEEKRIENILTSIAQSEPTEVLANNHVTPINVNIVEVSVIEKDIIEKIEEEIKPSVEEKVEVIVEENIIESTSAITTKEVNVPIESNENVEKVEEGTFKPKKKSKKGTQKPLTKKVIITDIFNDLSIDSIEPKKPVKRMLKKVEEIKPVITELIPVAVESSPSPVKELTPELEVQLTEKKSKKKKKNKNPKPISHANSTVSDDSLDNILENTLADEIPDKTNDEISVELDKLIQKGMYSSLQEKIKTVNVGPEADGFFKTIESLSAPSSKDKPVVTPLKAPDFNRIFQSTRQFLKPNMVSVEHDIKVDIDDKDTKAYSSTTDAANPSTGHVLDYVEDVQKAPVDPHAPVEEEIEDSGADKKLYPITQAVKEWMSKTREATPEVEILKSPSTIQKEFGDDNLKNLLDLDQEDEEITLFSTEETLNQEQPDLLEYWENDLPVFSKDCDLTKDIICNASKVCADGKSCDKCRTDSIKQDDEEIEVYESKYGQNEAFLHLQNEMRDAPDPKRLPYRAVCCSLQ